MSSLSTTISLAAAAALFFAAGCENADSKDGVSWNGAGSKKPAAAETEAETGDAAAADAVSFSSLHWSYGGFRGGSAQPSGVVISGLSVSKDSLSFSYVSNLSEWGLSRDQADALACFFVQKSDGSWVGGKFDWISTSRTGRSLGHVKEGYNGWSLSGVPNPCGAAFVIVSSDGTKRSNVISSTWSR